MSLPVVTELPFSACHSHYFAPWSVKIVGEVCRLTEYLVPWAAYSSPQLLELHGVLIVAGRAGQLDSLYDLMFYLVHEVHEECEIYRA